MIHKTVAAALIERVAKEVLISSALQKPISHIQEFNAGFERFNKSELGMSGEAQSIPLQRHNSATESSEDVVEQLEGCNPAQEVVSTEKPVTDDIYAGPSGCIPSPCHDVEKGLDAETNKWIDDLLQMDGECLPDCETFQSPEVKGSLGLQTCPQICHVGKISPDEEPEEESRKTSVRGVENSTTPFKEAKRRRLSLSAMHEPVSGSKGACLQKEQAAGQVHVGAPINAKRQSLAKFASAKKSRADEGDSEADSGHATDGQGNSGRLPQLSGKQKRRRSTATDKQSVAARLRRERISQRIIALQELVPNGKKLDTVSMLDCAIEYVLSLQKKLASGSEKPEVHPTARQGRGIVGWE
eukprot:jgi/Mesen1/1114/ME000123S00281